MTNTKKRPYHEIAHAKGWGEYTHRQLLCDVVALKFVSLTHAMQPIKEQMNSPCISATILQSNCWWHVPGT